MNYIGAEPAPAGLILVGDTNPVGDISFQHRVPDASYLQLNGQVVIKANYPDLWAYAQAFLTADQVANPGLYRDVSGTTFAVPKLDGLFIRAQGSFDANRTSAALGVRQDDDNKSHQHSVQLANIGNFAPPGGATQNLVTASAATSTSLVGGTEARPVNVALVPCVKALRTILIPTGTISPAYAFATQAEVDAGTEAAKAISPATLKFGRGVADVWCRFSMANPPVIQSSHGVATVTRASVGSYTVNFSSPFPNVTYCPVVSGDNIGGVGNILPCAMTPAVGSVGICNTGASFGTLADGGFCNLAIFSV